MLITAFLISFLLIVLLFSFIIVSTFVGFISTRVPLVRSKEADTRQVLQAAGIADEQVFYDLGSGDGTVVFIAERLAKLRATGFELTVWVHVWARIKARIYKSSATFKRSNFFNHSLSEADIVYCFLFPPLMARVEAKFIAEARPGTVLISRDFALPNYAPSEVIEINDLHAAYIYKK